MLLDSLAAGAILLFLLYTMIPMASLLLHEREVLSERRLIASMLHDDLQDILSDSNQQLPFHHYETFNTKEIKYHYHLHDTKLIEALALE